MGESMIKEQEMAPLDSFILSLGMICSMLCYKGYKNRRLLRQLFLYCLCGMGWIYQLPKHLAIMGYREQQNFLSYLEIY
jgi:hypothetical protein